MLRAVCLTICASLVLLSSGCSMLAVRRVGADATILVTGELTPDGVAAAAAVAESEPRCLWLAAGEVAADQRWREFGGIDADLRLMAAAGVDAVVLSPRWLQDGPASARQLVDAAGFVTLCANISDTSGIPIGYPWSVKRCGSTAIALSAVWSALDHPVLQQRGLHLTDAATAARRLLPILRMRASTTALLVVPQLAGVAHGYSFAAGDSSGSSGLVRFPGRDSAVVLRCATRDSEIAFPVEVQTRSLSGGSRKPSVVAVADSIRNSVDTKAAGVGVVLGEALSPTAFARRLALSVVETTGADLFLYDVPFIKKSVAAGDLTFEQILGIVNEVGPCVFVEVTSDELRELLRDSRLAVVWRPGTLRPSSGTIRTYRLATMWETLNSNLGLPIRRHQRLPVRLWQLAAEALRGESK